MRTARSSYSTSIREELFDSSDINIPELKKMTKTIYVSYNNDNQVQKPLVDYIEHYRNTFGDSANFIKRRVDYSKMKVFDEKLRRESERLKSFKDFPYKLFGLTKSISKSGFYYIGNAAEPDKVKCIFCQGILFAWKITDIPNKEHRKSFPTCPFLLNLNVGNEPQKEDLQNYLKIDPDLNNVNSYITYVVITTSDNLSFSLPSHLELDIEFREKTFDDLQNLKYLSLEGLFLNKKDSLRFIKCSMCNKEIELLRDVETLPSNVFHTPLCNYKRKYLDAFRSPSTHLKKRQRTNSCTVEFSVTDEEIDARVDARKVENVLDNRNIIKALIASKLKTTGKDYESVFELLQDSYHFKANQEAEPKSNYLEYILPDHFCVVCLDNIIEVVFLPCGHLRTCKRCSNALTTCPVCRKLIERRVYGIQFNQQ